MQYANGREAQIGDQIVGRDHSGQPFAGVVVHRYPGADTCNIVVVPMTATRYTLTAAQCLHVDDALPEQR